MRRYVRAKIEGGTYFFTVNLAQRRDSHLLIDRTDALRDAFRIIRRAHPFRIDAIVVLPEHLHAIWTLPSGDLDFSTRWSLIKARFSRTIEPGEYVSTSRSRRRERGIWQRRYYEHVVRDEAEFSRHVDYIHWNPVKHGWVKRVADWLHSSFHQYVRHGWLPANWAAQESVANLDLE